MRRILAILLVLLGWTAIIIQFYLMMQNSVETKLETTVRFFSFFTILTNIIVASFFSAEAFKPLKAHSKGLTPITVYITIVGLVYQILLRHTWNPTGLQMIVDELLHSVIPFLVIVYWFLFQSRSESNYLQIAKWMLFPLLYLSYILIRGSLSGFYPYPFINVPNLGIQQVLINSALILIGFVVISAIFIRLKKLSNE